MKQQISNRLGVAHVRDTMMQFVTGAITRQQAMESLQVGQSQLYSLRTSYLAARAQGRGGGVTGCEKRKPLKNGTFAGAVPQVHEPDFRQAATIAITSQPSALHREASRH